MKTLYHGAVSQEAALAGAVVGMPTIIPSSVLGADGKASPNSKVNVAMISCGGRAGYAANYHSYPNQPSWRSGSHQSRRLAGKAVRNCDDYSDFREVLARKDVRCGPYRNTGHWHVPISIMAARAARTCTPKTAGNQYRADKSRARYGHPQACVPVRSTAEINTTCRSGIELVLNGHIGEVKEAYVWRPTANPRDLAETPVPDGFDYDMWLARPKGPSQRPLLSKAPERHIPYI